MTRTPEKRRGDRGGLTVALIAFFAAITGAAVGGLGTYLGNRALQDEQSRSSAKGIARVLESQLIEAEPRLRLALRERRVIVPEALSPVRLELPDEELLASNLGAAGWGRVAEAISGLSLEREATEPAAGDMAALKARAGLHVRLEGPLLEIDRALLHELDQGVAALRPLSGV